MSDSLRADLDRLEPELIAIRRDLHEHPELGFEEERTAGLVANRLRDLGLEVRTGVGGTGVLADLAGEATGPTLLVRADMDALPVQETTGHDFSSRRAGVMHACGHDAHTAALIGGATLLVERRREIAGRVRFVFQPAEELIRGAPAMIQDGALEGVDRVLGGHVFSIAPVGAVLGRAQHFLAGCDAFTLTVIGRAGHGGMPDTSVDPIYAAAQLVTALQSIVARETKPGERLVVSIGAIDAGKAANVVVDQAVLKGTVRWFDEDQRFRALERIEKIAAGVCSALRAEYRFDVDAWTPVTSNTPPDVDVLRGAVARTGRAEVVDPGPVTASEDFAYFLQQRPGCFFGVGAGGPGAAPHHHHAFDIDERAVALMAEVYARTTLEALAPPG